MKAIDPWARDIVQRLRRQWWRVRVGLRLNRSAPVVGILWYPCFRLTVQELKRLGVTQLTPMIWSQGFRPSRRKREELQSQLGVVRQAWEKALGDPTYRAQFQLLGIDCAAFCTRIFNRTIEDVFPKALRQMAAVTELCREVKLSVLVVPDDWSQFSRLCVLAAQAAGIPTLVVQHGLTCHRSDSTNDLMTSDEVCVVADWDVERVRERRPGVPISVIGCLQLDEYGQRPSVRAALPKRAPGTPLRVLVLTNTSSSHKVYYRAIESEMFLAGVCQALQGLGKLVEVGFKLHPSEKVARYEAALELLSPSFPYKIISGWTLRQALPEYDLVIGAVSTALLESMYLGKPTIYFRSTAEPVPASLGPNVLTTAGGAAELEQLLRIALEGAEPFVAPLESPALAGVTGPLDGKASQRLCHVIARIAERK